MNIKKATLSDLESVTHLFNEYRIFYKQPSNPEGAKIFILERLTTGDSVIFLASDDRIHPTLSDIHVDRDEKGMDPQRSLCV